MAELLVIHDKERDIAAIVDVDNRVGWGPAMIGPNAGTILETFIDSVPWDITRMSSYDARDAFASFLEHAGVPATPETGADNNAAVQQPGNPGVDDGAALAQAEAVSAGETPPEQPADADVEADAGAAPEMRQCPNCQGTGSINVGDPPVAQQCPMCKGAKTVVVVP